MSSKSNQIIGVWWGCGWQILVRQGGSQEAGLSVGAVSCPGLFLLGLCSAARLEQSHSINPMRLGVSGNPCESAAPVITCAIVSVLTQGHFDSFTQNNSKLIHRACKYYAIKSNSDPIIRSKH